ncbi:hypothetical protein M2H09_22920, partial [Vibrio vulnificus]|nr:hypothetical protein [Vibrio vulnificus]
MVKALCGHFYIACQRP